MSRSSSFFSSPRPSGTLASSIALAALVFAASPALAQGQGSRDAKQPFSFELGAGYRYSSLLAVPDLDTTSTGGDHAFTLDGAVKLDLDLTERTSLDAGLGFSQVAQNRLDAFDIRSLIGSLTLKHDFRIFNAGISYHHADAELGGDGYMAQQRLSPFVSKRFGRSVMLRGAYVRAEKDFDLAVERDATSQALDLDAYFFLDGSKTYLTVGYMREQNDARAAEFDFDADHYKLGLVHNFSIVGFKSRFKVGYTHEQRDYDSITPSIGVVRDDQRDAFDAQLRVNFTDSFHVALEHEVRDRSSNLPSADYSQNLTTLRVGLEF